MRTYIIIDMHGVVGFAKMIDIKKGTAFKWAHTPSPQKGRRVCSFESRPFLFH